MMLDKRGIFRQNLEPALDVMQADGMPRPAHQQGCWIQPYDTESPGLEFLCLSPRTSEKSSRKDVKTSFCWTQNIDKSTHLRCCKWTFISFSLFKDYLLITFHINNICSWVKLQQQLSHWAFHCWDSRSFQTANQSKVPLPMPTSARSSSPFCQRWVCRLKDVTM